MGADWAQESNVRLLRLLKEVPADFGRRLTVLAAPVVVVAFETSLLKDELHVK